LAKKKIIIAGLDDNKKKTPVKKFNTGLIRNIIIAAVILAVLSVGLVKYIEASNNYIGTVDGRKIYIYEFEEALNDVIYEMEQEEIDKLEDPDDWDEVKKEAFWAQVDDSGKSNRTKAKEKALEKVIEQKVKLSEAAARGIYLDNRQKKEIIRQAEQDLEYYINYYSTQFDMTYKNLNDFTKKMWNISLSQYIEQQAVNWIINKLDNVEKSKIEVSDEEMKEWYDKAPYKYDTYVVKRIMLSFKDSSGNMLEGYDLVQKQKIVDEIEQKLKDGKAIDDLISEYEEQIVKSKSGDHKFSVTEEGEFEADLDDINEWMKTAKEGDWTKIEVKEKIKVKEGEGDEEKEVEKEVVSTVYFVKYELKIAFDTEDERYAKELRDMHKSIRSEIINDKYDKLVKEEWMNKDQYKIVFNKDIYKKFKVVGMEA